MAMNFRDSCKIKDSLDGPYCLRSHKQVALVGIYKYQIYLVSIICRIGDVYVQEGRGLKEKVHKGG